MRWRFAEPNDLDAPARSRIVAKIDQWWQAFTDRADDMLRLFSHKSQWDLPSWMHAHLNAIDPNLMWEFGPGLHGGTRLVITPESERHLRPLVDGILRRAPHLAGWEFYAHRLAESVPEAASTLQCRCNGFEINGLEAKVQRASHNLIDIIFRSPHFADMDETEAGGVAFVATESLLGEEHLDRWIGDIGVQPSPHGLGKFFRRNNSAWLSLDRLKPTTDSLIESIREQLPTNPLNREPPLTSDTSSDQAKNAGAVFKMQPAKKDDYPHRSDLFVAVSSWPDWWWAAHAPNTFCSTRYARNNVLFAYLKMDGREGFDNESWTDRAELEDELQAELSASHLGGVLGGGTGLIYSYIDLLLANVEQAIPLIRKILRDGRIHKRTWLMFFDAELSSEWVGVYEDTPAPPQ